MKKYKITINWYGENLKFYTSAEIERSALLNAISQLAKKLSWDIISVKRRVLNAGNNYTIKEIKEDERS